MSEDLAFAYAHCGLVLREEDRDAWLAALFAPAGARPHLHALGAFFLEIRRVRDRVRQPLAGEIRLQWWCDALQGEARGDAEANPVAAALLDTVAHQNISPGMLIDAVEAHRMALYGEAPETEADLERFFDRTIGACLRAQVGLLGASESRGTGTTPADAWPTMEDAVRAAAIALGVADILRHLGHYVNRRFAVIPDEVLVRHGLSQADIAAWRGEPNPAIGRVLGDLRALARTRLVALRAERPRIPEAVAPAFLTASLVEPLLRASERTADPLAAELEVPQWLRQWRLWRASRRGGVL